MRILIVEDDDRIADFLSRALKAEGHTSVRVADGKDALDVVSDGDFELVVLDVMLPTLSGFEVCQILRQRCLKVPVIMLTALDSVEDVVRGLRMGADDYMTKPFDLDELLARIEAVGRRGAAVPDHERLEVGQVALDLRSMVVTVDEAVVSMTARELAVLELLLSSPDRLFSRERILNNVWGVDKDPLTNVVDVYISKLRKKLTTDPSVPFIETVRGLGYRINRALVG